MLSKIAFVIVVLFVSSSVLAQSSRAVKAGSLILDDGAGHTISIEVPTTLGSSFTWTLPQPPAIPTASGFVPTGTLGGQTLRWNNGTWNATSNLMDNDTTLKIALSLLPTSDNTLNIGSATQRIDTLFASNIIGPALGGGSSYFQRTGTTLSTLTAGDNINTAGQLQIAGSNGTSTFEARDQHSVDVNYTLPDSNGTALTMLANDGSGNLNWYSPIKFVRKTADQNYTGTSLRNDAHLALKIGADETYTFEALLMFSDSTVSGASPKINVTVPSGATIKWGFFDADGLADAQKPTGFPSSQTSPTSIQIDNDPLGTAETSILVKGLVINGSTAGNIQIQAGSSSSSPMKLHLNSYLQATRVQ